MISKLIFQKSGENTFSSSIKEAFSKDPKSVYFLFGNLKEDGFKIIEDELIDRKVKAFFAIGIDKKNTTRSMLEDMVTYTKDVYYYSNNDIIEFDSNVCVFEYKDKVEIYVNSACLSESTMNDNICIYVKIVYDLLNKVESDEYKENIKELITNIKKETFNKLDKDIIIKLVDDKEIFTTRQYNHNVKSISELLGKSPDIKENKKEISKNEIDDIYTSDIKMPKIDLSDISIDFDDFDFSSVEDQVIEDKVKLKKEEKKNKTVAKEDTKEEYEDIEDEVTDEILDDTAFDINGVLNIDEMLLKKSDIILDVSKEDTKKNKNDCVQVKSLNLNNITNVIFELSSKTSKGNDVKSIKFPNSLNKLIPNFLAMSEVKTAKDVDGMYKRKKVELDIIDVKENQHYKDINSNINFRTSQSYITINSDVIGNIDYKEKDIVRIIKLSKDIYHIEIISKDMQEYRVWHKLCTQTFKASDKKFGIM